MTREGRISPGDLGIWSDEHIEPLARIARKASTLAPISAIEVSAGLPERVPPYAVRPCRVVRAPSAMQDGQWNPTAASRMQSGQIGLPQFEQETPVSRFGWR